MISENMLRRIAAQRHLGLAQAEHEYVILCTLDGLGQVSPPADTFCLKGGTALRLLYFSEWRHSVDLDFSVLPEFPDEDLEAHLEGWFARVEEIHGLVLRLRQIHRANGAARLRAQFTGPLRHPARLLLDITLDEPVLLPPRRQPVVVDFFAPLRPVVQVYALEEVLAEKVRSILERGKSRDYYDVWRLLKEKQEHLDLALARQVLGQKCVHKGLEVSGAAALLSPARLEEARPYWERDLAGQVSSGALPSWEAVVEELAGLLEEFFAEMPKQT